MPSTLDLCEKLYGTRDVYALFEVDKKAKESEIKKAYYKLSLKVHPDRVKEEDKQEATEKFKVLSKIHSVLSDAPKRALYDEKGIIDDDDEESLGANWLAMWQQFFKPITTEDISNFEKEYTGSELERNDIRKAYLGGKGCLNHMLNSVPFMNCEDEPRIAVIVKEMIAAGEVPEYKIFTEEPKAKRDRRHKKYAKEAREAAAIKEKLEKKENEKRQSASGATSLEQQIALRQADRQAGFASLLDKLAQKYGDGDDDEEAFDLEQYVAKKKSKAKGTPQGKKKQQGATGGKGVKEGRVSKKSL
ncbi:J domain-containing protein CG6693 isoform X1 [Culex quinquefasciatus]|uniref:J domain-containing protein CG6693 n=2 Tax=Culex pipiens TaxID=7175 RepID=A0A8D8L880_CULPI|nr:J domain-containing protein CG6693 isoform X1 [Culex quinquefasciatus]